MPGRRLWDQFLGKLWDINSLDALHNFFDNLFGMLAKTKEERKRLAELGQPVEEEEGIKLSPNSPFGTFSCGNTFYLVPSLTHYLKFLDSWRAGDYPTAFDYLHRYFDYTMQNRDRLFYQYALMNLAVLQADFGCHKEAVAAMLETVSTARENRDMTCLNFALNWLFHFGRAHPDLVQNLESSSMLGTGK
ncbi:anaphase-promoting complex subunit 5, partial [Fusarium langsethiae]